ncbi:hypothetical protein RZS08_59565, partial [Arthrospira platensis SPKY1]|nr:hypothetical protein [Arthrospira platensis SPKY1]
MENPYWVGYMESHDEERLMVRMRTNGNTSNPEHNVRELQVSLERMKAMGTTFLIPGPKMLWQFGELGYDFPIDFNGRTGNKPVRWDYYRDPERLKLYK